MLHEKLTRDIIGAAMTVHNTLRPGLDEKVYEHALAIELQSMGHRVDQQEIFEIHYKEHLIGKLQLDLIVDGLVIVDTKVVTNFNDVHVLQMLGYLNITRMELALLVNFSDARLRWKRVVASRSIHENMKSSVETD